MFSKPSGVCHTGASYPCTFKLNVLSAIPSLVLALIVKLKSFDLFTSNGTPFILKSSIRNPGGRLPAITLTVTPSVVARGKSKETVFLSFMLPKL